MTSVFWSVLWNTDTMHLENEKAMKTRGHSYES